MNALPVTGGALSLRLVRAHATRGALVWLAAHTVLALASGEISPLGLRGTVVTASAAFAVSHVDRKRTREAGFLGNLGVPVILTPAIAAAVIIALEAVLATVSSFVR